MGSSAVEIHNQERVESLNRAAVLFQNWGDLDAREEEMKAHFEALKKKR